MQRRDFCSFASSWRPERASRKSRRRDASASSNSSPEVHGSKARVVAIVRTGHNGASTVPKPSAAPGLRSIARRQEAAA